MSRKIDQLTIRMKDEVLERKRQNLEDFTLPMGVPDKPFAAFGCRAHLEQLSVGAELLAGAPVVLFVLGQMYGSN